VVIARLLRGVTVHRELLLAAGGGALFALSAPPTNGYACVLIGIGLLAAAMQSAERFAAGLLRGALWATAAGLVGLRFVPSVIRLFTDLGTVASVAAHVLLSAAQSLTWALGMGVAALLRSRLRAPLELAVGAGVLVTLLLPSVFVWSPAGLLSPWTPLVQLADLVGERGVSVALAVSSALAVRGATGFARARTISWRRTRRSWASIAAAAAIPLAMMAYGVHAMDRVGESPSAPEQLAVGLVHAGVDPKERWQGKHHHRILRTLQRETAAVERAGAELSVWPEAAYPFRLSHQAKRAPRGARSPLGGGVRGPVLFGLITIVKPELVGRDANGRPVYERNRFNSATVVSPSGTLQPPYDKMQLLWFGETVPLGEQLPWLRRIFQRSGRLLAGQQLRPLLLTRDDAPAVRMGVLNCYEDTLPDLGRRIASELQPDLLVNVTNDAWFIGTSEPELHFRLSVMRAIELRRDLVRAVNLGVAGWIDARGVVRARYDSSAPGHLLVRPQLRSGQTIYTRFGDVPLVLLLALSALGARWFAARSRSTRRTSISRS